MNYLLSSFLSFLCALCWGQKEKQRFAYQLQGEVKTLTVTKEELPEAQGDLNVDHFDDNQQITFDPQGRIIEFVSYRKGKRPTTIKKTSYDAKGRLTREILSIAAEDLTQTTIYEYDDTQKRGKATSTSTGFPNKKSKMELTMTPNDQIAEVIAYDFEGELITKSVLEYNKNKYLTQSRTYNDKNKLEHKSSYEYDHNNRLTKVENTIIRPHFEIKSSFEYIYENNIYPIKHIFTLNQDAPNTYSFQYKLDHKGNWIEKTYLHKGKAVAIIKREITYY
ncbi:hypothetical protein [Capnocytophaga granulosa]|uniref:hypothetical protein n=1 Tax=Capnocytophaga granulosa TaxID=45242 RepID=UPI003857866B